MQISVLITTIGAIIIDSSHGRLSSSSGETPIIFSRRRGRIHPMITSAGNILLTGPKCSSRHYDDDSPTQSAESRKLCISLSCSSSMQSSSVRSVIACTRGGSMDDHAQQQPPQSRRRGGEGAAGGGRYIGHDDTRLPPRRTPSPHDRYAHETERDRRNQSGSQTNREVDLRGVLPPRSDPEVGDRGPRPRPSHQGRRDKDRDRRDNRFDNSNMMEQFDDDRSSQWNGRDRGRSARDRREQGNPSPTANVARRKSWFTSKIDRGKIPPKDGDTTDERRGVDLWDSPFPPPPPPPPTTTTFDETSLLSIDINPAQTDRVPIHYMFPTADTAAEERQMSDVPMNDYEINPEQSTAMDDTLDVPFLDVEDEFADRKTGRRRRIKDYDEDGDKLQQYDRASPRRDTVTIFMSTRRGALKVRVGSIIVGAAIGGFVGKSLTNDPVPMAVVMSSLLFVTGFLRNDYGELSRALGLAFVLTLGRTSFVRKEYPTLPHLKAMIRQSPRKPFPPIDDGDSPWRYEPIYRDDPEFKMTYALLAMACVGSFCGGNVPIIPAWIGGIVGAVVFASMTTGANARGDLGRTMGMRLVGLIQVVLAINSELRILGKTATVGGLIFDKVMIMDRKHRIKDKIVAICKWGYDKVSKTAEQVKEDLQDERPLRR